MKQFVTFTEHDLTLNEKEFLFIWKKRKYNDENPYLTIGECLELLVALTSNLKFDMSDGRFFNNMLINTESIVGWEGKELIDILFYELKLALRRKLATSYVFPS